MAGPIGGVITFIAALHVANDVLAGGTPSWTAADRAGHRTWLFGNGAGGNFRACCIGPLGFGGHLFGRLYAWQS